MVRSDPGGTKEQRRQRSSVVGASPVATRSGGRFLPADGCGGPGGSRPRMTASGKAPQSGAAWRVARPWVRRGSKQDQRLRRAEAGRRGDGTAGRQSSGAGGNDGDGAGGRERLGNVPRVGLLRPGDCGGEPGSGAHGDGCRGRPSSSKQRWTAARRRENLRTQWR